MDGGRRGSAEERSAASRRVAAAYRARAVERAYLEVDGAAAAALEPEIRPLAEALLAPAAIGDGGAREALALGSLLGRRAARLGLSPGALATAVDDLGAALAGEVELPSALQRALRAVLLEGYVAARTELAAQRRAQELAEAVAVLRPVPGLVVVTAHGPQDPDALAERFEALARRLHAENAQGCVVHGGGLAEPAPPRAERLFELVDPCRMLGVRLWMAELPSSWRAHAPRHDVMLADSFTAALDAALAHCGHELRARRESVLSRLVDLARGG